jgi:Tol biopolymer transport system component
MLTDKQKEAVQRHLKKVLASSEFARSERAAAFLTYIVTRALDQDSETLKERTIGIAVFERPEDWDPKLDTTVRTEARRLRKKLSGYYASPAGEDQYVCIDVPLGAYVPKFRFVETANHRLTELAPTPNAAAVPNRERETDQDGLGTIHTARVNPWKQVLSGHALLICSLVVAAPLLTTFVISLHSRKPSVLPPFQTLPLTAEYGNEFDPAISPNANQIAYVWDGSTSGYRIYIRSVKGGSPSRLTSGNSPELDPAFSPDGKQIAYLRVEPEATDVVIRNLDDGTEHIVGEIATQIGDWTGDPGPLIGNLGPTWTPDGSNLIVADFAPHSTISGIFEIKISDGSRRQLTTTEDSVQDFLPRVSRDGRILAFVRAVTHGISDVYLLDLATHALIRATDDNRSINGLAWGRNDDKVVISSNRDGTYQLWILDLPKRSLQKLDTASTTAIDPQIAVGSGWMAYVTTNQNWNIGRVSLDEKVATSVDRFIASSGRNHSARYSPDGKYVAFVSDRSGAWEIWLCQVDCAEPQKLTSFNGPWIGGLSWSPDSTHLAFDARPGRKSAIYTLSITNPAPEILEKNAYEERMPFWSIDGRTIYFNSDRDGSVSIWRRDMPTGDTRRVGSGFSAQELDPAGRLLIGRSDGTIWQVKEPGDLERSLSDDIVVDPVLAWTVHEGVLYYCSSAKDGRVRIARFENGHQQTIAVLSISFPRTSATLDISPDGKSLLLTSTDHSSSNVFRRIGSLPL